MAAVAHHQAPPSLVSLGRQLGYVLVDFCLQRGGQHPPGALADNLVDQGARLRQTVGIHYAEHGVPSRPALRTRAYSVTITGSFGKVRPSCILPEPIHKS